MARSGKHSRKSEKQSEFGLFSTPHYRSVTRMLDDPLGKRGLTRADVCQQVDGTDTLCDVIEDLFFGVLMLIGIPQKAGIRRDAER